MFGLNVLAQFIDDRAALLNWVTAARPNVILIMDDIGLARQIKASHPSMTVIYRHWHPRDHEWFYHWSAAEWLAQHAPFAQGGIVLQAGNEPQGYGDVRPLVTAYTELLQLAAAANIRIVAPNFAVGHPSIDLLLTGAFDDLWRAFARYPQHIYGCHEYAVYSTQDERPFRIGRFLEVIHRCHLLNVSPPRIIVTESGRDIGGGENDGWRAVFDETEYADFLDGLRDLYGAYHVDTTVFCYGRGANGRWQSFNVEGANTVLQRLVDYNQSTGDEMYKLFRPGASYLNIRREPVVTTAVVNGKVVATNQNRVGTVSPDEYVQVNKITGGFALIRKQDGVEGYVSEQNGAVVIERL